MLTRVKLRKQHGAIGKADGASLEFQILDFAAGLYII